MRSLKVLILLGLVAVFGCGGTGGGGGGTEPDPTASQTVQMIKSILEDVAESGEAEQAGELISYVEEDLAGEDAAKSESLLPEVKELEALTDPTEIKAKAKEILGKL